MNTISKAILMTVAISLPALSTNGYSHQQSGNNSGNMMSPKMMRQQMTNMRDRMQENHALMDKAMSEQNIEKRKKMTQEHMQSMQQQMQEMNQLTDDEMHNSYAKPGMDNRVEMMGMRMNMMQMMMEQMMNHQNQIE
jgi:protein CpxP